MKHNQTIVITGASSGVGKAIALEFAIHQSKLVLVARNWAALQDTAGECEALGSTVRCVEADVTDSGAMIEVASIADDFGGKIDVWINNAGVLAAGPFDETPMEVHDQIIRTNLLGYIHGSHAVLPYFKKQKHGILVNNISIGGFMPVPNGVGYSASKFGLRGFSSALKAELSDWPDIHICDIFPAFLDTPGISHAANYTGKFIKPAPPVYDPRRVAMAVVKLVENPKAETMIGSMAVLIRLANSVCPWITTRITQKVISTYLKNADHIDKTDGNLFNTVKFGNSIHGGWGRPGRPKAHRKYLLTGFLLASVAGFLMVRNSRG